MTLVGLKLGGARLSRASGYSFLAHGTYEIGREKLGKLGEFHR